MGGSPAYCPPESQLESPDKHLRGGSPLEARAVFWGGKQGSRKLPQHIPSWVPGAVPACSCTHVCFSPCAHGNLRLYSKLLKLTYI